MDFQELISAANSNKQEAQYEASIKRYSSVLPPPKKVPKSNVQSSGIKKFLEKKKAEEEARLNEARKQKEQLLALRAKSTKNSKKAKIMASRTKDNDFSKIRLTDDEIEAKRKREEMLIRQNLANKVERMKARIEMEEKEKMLPKKRKRKSKNSEHIESHDDPSEDQHNGYCDSISDVRMDRDRSLSDKSNGARKPPKPAPPALSFSELLKVAEKKQYEPVPLAVKKKEDEKLLTKKERRLLQIELDRQKRKQERLKEMEQAENNRSSSSQANINKDTSENLTEKSKKPYVIHVEKDVPKSGQQPKFKIPKSTNASSSKNIPEKAKETSTRVNNKMHNRPNPNSEKSMKSVPEQKKVTKSKGETSSFHKNVENRKKVMVPKKNETKVNPVSAPAKRIAHVPIKHPTPAPAKSNTPAPAKSTVPAPAKAITPAPPKRTGLAHAEPAVPAPKFDEDALTAAIEKRIRERIEKEMEEKLAAKFGLKLKNSSPPDKATAHNKVSEVPKQIIKKEPTAINNSSKKAPDKPMLSKKDMEIERRMAMHKRAMEQKLLARKLPAKKPFHTNPYLDPPRRLLEPQRFSKPPPKRRIESDDEDEDEDDMSDFIDDGPSQNDEDYSKYIQEIFGYDRNRYVDDDDDDIMETSFAEQMKEEVKSAKLGYLEDLEEERKENERKKRKKLKK